MFKPLEYRVTFRAKGGFFADRDMAPCLSPKKIRRRLERQYAEFESYRIAIWNGEERIEPSDFEVLIPGVGDVLPAQA